MILDFNKIFFIESVDLSSEIPNCKNLYYSLHEPSISYDDVDTEDDLLYLLKQILNECKRDHIKPIIDLSMHGLGDKSGMGLWFSDIDYTVLLDKLLQINKASEYNLFLVTSACCGLYLINSLRPDKPCPFNRIFASQNDTFEQNLEVGFLHFYNELCKSHDLNQALGRFYKFYTGNHNDFYHLDAQDVFKILTERKARLEMSQEYRINHLKRYKEEIGRKRFSFRDRYDFRMHQLPNRIANTLNEHKKAFFMFDEFPQNQHKYTGGWVPDYKTGQLAGVKFKK